MVPGDVTMKYTYGKLEKKNFTLSLCMDDVTVLSGEAYCTLTHFCMYSSLSAIGAGAINKTTIIYLYIISSLQGPRGWGQKYRGENFYT